MDGSINRRSKAACDLDNVAGTFAPRSSALGQGHCHLPLLVACFLGCDRAADARGVLLPLLPGAEGFRRRLEWAAAGFGWDSRRVGALWNCRVSMPHALPPLSGE